MLPARHDNFWQGAIKATQQRNTMTTNFNTPLKTDGQQDSSINGNTIYGRSINDDFVKALGELKNVAKNSINPHFRNRYASLDAILDAVRPSLASNGIALSQSPLFHEGCAGVTTRIIHVSGKVWESTLVLPLKDQTAQGVGSAITYARRYAICAILGIAADDDDDGHEASKPEPKKVSENKPPATEQAPIGKLCDLMWSNSIEDAHVIEFMIAKKVVADRNVKLSQLDEKTIKRLIASWEDIVSFKPVK